MQHWRLLAFRKLRTALSYEALGFDDQQSDGRSSDRIVSVGNTSPATSQSRRTRTPFETGRGLYARTGYVMDFERQVVLACKRVPAGVVCLESAAKYHSLFPSESTSIWMAIDSKAKKPIVDGLKLRFVRFSGLALTQGVVNTKIEGVHVRIYSAAKTVADCLKYRRKIRKGLAARILRETIAGKKCSEQRLRHFAKICRVVKLVHAAYFSARNAGSPLAH